MNTLMLLKSSKCFINLSIFHFIIFIYVFPFKVNSQNLVDNWSFEDTLFCPIGPGQMHAASWEIYGGTADYYHACHQNPSTPYNYVGVPNNRMGYQLPHSGQSYAGLIVTHSFVSNARETLGRPLNSPLQIGVKYYVSFYVVRAINPAPNFLTDIASNNIGINFTTVDHSFPNGGWPINFNSQVYTDSIITDTINWTKISGSFVADSAYIYMGISNFFPDSVTDRIIYGNNVFGYYFVDDICVSQDSAFCDQLLSTNDLLNNEIIKLFPNPARDWIVVNDENIQSLRFYDVSGRIVHTISAPIPLTIDVSSLPSAIYIVAIETKKYTTFQKLLVTH